MAIRRHHRQYLTKKQRNFTDPESKIMRKDKTFIQGYNAQAAVDAERQIIVACDLDNNPSDSIQLSSMVKQIKTNTNQKPRGLSADAGYFSKKNILFLRSQHIAAYIPPDKQRHNVKIKALRGPITKNMSVADRMRRRPNRQVSNNHSRKYDLNSSKWELSGS